jgi:hypothetical protein
MAKTSPFVIRSVDELTALQVLPFHAAQRHDAEKALAGGTRASHQ